jgi:3-deoxy-D-arabino-heptulosonate 7-phosphate (DAHP) synthase
MIEVHNDPEHALCDGAQSLTPAQFAVSPPRLNDKGGRRAMIAESSGSA